MKPPAWVLALPPLAAIVGAFLVLRAHWLPLRHDLVVGARSARTQASQARLVGNRALNWLASHLTGRDVPDLTSGFRAARRQFLNGLGQERLARLRAVCDERARPCFAVRAAGRCAFP